jgi:hypothetical protein
MMDQAACLHILTNPWGWGEKEKRQAMHFAADEIERLQKALRPEEGARDAALEEAAQAIESAQVTAFASLNYEGDTVEQIIRDILILAGMRIRGLKRSTMNKEGS